MVRYQCRDSCDRFETVATTSVSISAWGLPIPSVNRFKSSLLSDSHPSGLQKTHRFVLTQQVARCEPLARDVIVFDFCTATIMPARFVFDYCVIFLRCRVQPFCGALPPAYSKASRPPRLSTACSSDP